MKCKYFFLPFLLLLLVSCQMYYQEGKGKIVVVDSSQSNILKITDVWCKVEQAKKYESYYHENYYNHIEKDVSFFITPGHYDIIVRVSGFTGIYNDYQTGYKNPIRVKANETTFVIYDGQGIYNMEQSF